MRTKILLFVIVVLALVAVVTYGQARPPVVTGTFAAAGPQEAPKPPAAAVAPPATELGPNVGLDRASAIALAPLAKQRADLQQQIQTLLVKYQLVNAQWRVAEGKALAAANLDPGEYTVDPTGQKFVRRQGGPRP